MEIQNKCSQSRHISFSLGVGLYPLIAIDHNPVPSKKLYTIPQTLLGQENHLEYKQNLNDNN